MKTTHLRRVRRAALFAVSAVSAAAAALGATGGGAVASPASGGANRIVRIDDGLVRGADVASGNPSSRALPWPSFADGAQVMSLVPPQPQVEADFAAAHHCAFWAAG
jgi:hypothetical protein